MTADQVLRFKNAAPFHPFEMLLADGRSLIVPHPDFISVFETDDLVHLYGLSEGLETVDLMLVVSLRFPVKVTASEQA